jgi:hypothetical protein
MLVLLGLTLLACDLREAGEDWVGWYDEGSDLNVTEPIEWTDQNYALEPVDGVQDIADLQDAVFPGADGALVYGSGDELSPDSDCQVETDSALPAIVQGIVTLHPRFYFKTSGCGRDSDEKYYGSYFVQDSTGGVFVLGDSKVAHFDVGDRVEMRVRAIKTNFDLDMIYAHDIVVVERNASPIYFVVAEGETLGADDVGQVRRVTGEITQAADNFGEFKITDDSGTVHTVSLDAEINRRGVGFDVGTRVQATGPVLYSYSAYTIVIMNVGQLAELEE